MRIVHHLTISFVLKITSLDVVKETSKVVLNTAELELGTASVYSDALQKEQFQSDQSFDATQERAVFHFPTPLPAGSKAQFQISFSGPLTGSMTGYYKSSWEEEGKLKYYALTQFEVCPYIYDRHSHQLTR